MAAQRGPILHSLTPFIGARPTVVIASGSSWATLAIALAGLVLSLTALCWQAFTFMRSGSRVRVQTRWALVIASEHDALDRSYLSFLRFPIDWGSLKVLDFQRLVMVAVIQNRGRLPVTVRNSHWHFKGTDQISGHFTKPNETAWLPMPYRLEAHDECMSAMDFATMWELIVRPIEISRLEIFPMTELANGRTARGMTLVLPDAPEGWERPPDFGHELRRLGKAR